MFHFVKKAAHKLAAGLDKARGKVAAFIGAGAAVVASVAAPAANAAIDTTSSGLGQFTADMKTAADWVSGPLTGAIIALVAAGIVLAIIKWAGRKARPGS